MSYVNTLERLRQIEPLSRRDAQALGDQFFARQVPRHHLPLGTAKTSGSTGEPVTVRKIRREPAVLVGLHAARSSVEWARLQPAG